MQLFKWTKTHEIFLPELDAEHRNICRGGSEFYKAVLAGAPPERLSTLLQSLLESAESHFQHEERMMGEAEFPSFAWHKHQHDAVRHRAQELVNRIEAGDSGARIEFLGFLSGWIRDHTSVADRMMGAYLRNWQRRRVAVAS